MWKVYSKLLQRSGTINAPISRKENSIIERCIADNGATSITHYEVINEGIKNGICYSVLKCKLETGRTHQIRVHMAYISHPLLGDELYGGNMSLINRQALHSYKVSFIHPITNNKMNFKAILPNDLAQFFKSEAKGRYRFVSY